MYDYTVQYVHPYIIHWQIYTRGEEKYFIKSVFCIEGFGTGGHEITADFNTLLSPFFSI
jgi:hypothetical protein